MVVTGGSMGFRMVLSGSSFSEVVVLGFFSVVVQSGSRGCKVV